jgi:ArsR family transcriptional regulator
MDEQQVIRALAALAHPVRLTIFRALVVAGPAGLTPGVMQEGLGIPATTLSFHLKELAQAQLVSSERQGRSLLYQAAFRADECPARLPQRQLLPGRTLRGLDRRALRLITPEIAMKRFHVHTFVADLQASIDFYSKLFAAAPTRVEADYAKWMLEDPRLNFAISTRGGAKLGVDHLGLAGRQRGRTDRAARARRRPAAP